MYFLFEFLNVPSEFGAKPSEPIIAQNEWLELAQFLYLNMFWCPQNGDIISNDNIISIKQLGYIFYIIITNKYI
jgi:hypothetical protein